MKLSKYKFVVRETLIEHLKGNNRLEDRRVVIIGIEDKEKGIVYPHPITNFIKAKYEYKGRSLNTQKSTARTIAMFLNFIYEQIELGNEEFEHLVFEGVRNLNLIHGARFITSLTEKGLIRETVLKRESDLTSFYKYLSDLDLIDKQITFDVQLIKKGEEVIVSPFRASYLETQYPFGTQPTRQKLKNFPDKRKEGIDMVVEFIEEARRVSNEIAFGVALQIYGGLRRGEVVNLMKSSVPTDFIDNSIFILVQDNQEILFREIKDTETAQVKKPRIQMVLPTNYLKELYDEHVSTVYYRNSKNSNALFVNRDGTTITGQAYTKKFAKVKYSYIERLSRTNGRYSDFKLLSETYWGTHIGRGIFTNILAEIGLDDKQMALSRGDKNTDTSKLYLDQRKAALSFEEAMNELVNQETLDITNQIRDKWGTGASSIATRRVQQ
ncbi:site-specific integrase [Priestia megaterium]